ncbi:MAG: GNAT family N-acetyltransferase [Limisphaerales bacterium]
MSDHPEAHQANQLGQPIGPPLPAWTPPPFPTHRVIDGEYCRLEPVDPDSHAQLLFDALAADKEGRNWTYLPYGPFDGFDEFAAWLNSIAAVEDPQFYTIVPANTGKPAGLASYLRIDPTMGCIEVGHIHFAPGIQRSPVSTEAMFLMMRNAFELGYRRYEWKCDALNAPSRKAATRLGFVYEGTFRQAFIYKGRSRDTAWFAMIDSEWPILKSAFEAWLAESNFDPEGRQRRSLAACRNT